METPTEMLTPSFDWHGIDSSRADVPLLWLATHSRLKGERSTIIRRPVGT